jgi:hypothetical protein
MAINIERMCIYTAMIRNYERLNEQSQAAHSAKLQQKRHSISTRMEF